MTNPAFVYINTTISVKKIIIWAKQQQQTSKLNRFPYLGRFETAIYGFFLDEGWLPLALEVYSIHQQHHGGWAYAAFRNDVLDFAFWKIDWGKKR